MCSKIRLVKQIYIQYIIISSIRNIESGAFVLYKAMVKNHLNSTRFFPHGIKMEIRIFPMPGELSHSFLSIHQLSTIYFLFSQRYEIALKLYVKLYVSAICSGTSSSFSSQHFSYLCQQVCLQEVPLVAHLQRRQLTWGLASRAARSTFLGQLLLLELHLCSIQILFPELPCLFLCCTSISVGLFPTSSTYCCATPPDFSTQRKELDA